jgi:hypothetical protein
MPRQHNLYRDIFFLPIGSRLPDTPGAEPSACQPIRPKLPPWPKTSGLQWRRVCMSVSFDDEHAHGHVVLVPQRTPGKIEYSLAAQKNNEAALE